MSNSVLKRNGAQCPFLTLFRTRDLEFAGRTPGESGRRGACGSFPFAGEDGLVGASWPGDRDRHGLSPPVAAYRADRAARPHRTPMTPGFFLLVKFARSLLFSTVGFCFGCWLMRQHSIPKPALPHVVREKIADLQVHGNEYDAIFLGSSRIQNHVMPHVFDAAAGERGIPMHTFNFGISGMHVPEDDYLLDLILAQPHVRLRWVFVEIEFFDGAILQDEDGTIRGLYWHDWPRLCSVFRCLFADTGGSIFHRLRTIREKTPVFFIHAKLFFQRAVNLGRGADLAQGRLFQDSRSGAGCKRPRRSARRMAACPAQTGRSDGGAPPPWGPARQAHRDPPRRDAGDRGEAAPVRHDPEHGGRRGPLRAGHPAAPRRRRTRTHFWRSDFRSSICAILHQYLDHIVKT